MIIVDLGNRKLAFAFSHPKTQAPKRGQPLRYTHCEVFELSPGGQAKQLGEALTGCSIQDNFCKETGRKRALQKVICQHVFNPRNQSCKKCGQKFNQYLVIRLTRAERHKIWDTYLSRPRTNQKKAPKVEDLKAAPVLEGKVPPQNVHGLGYTGAD